jgi:hypothetical protein
LSHSKKTTPPSSGGGACPADGGSPACNNDQVKLVEVAEVVTVNGSPTRHPVVNSRIQYINLDDKVDTTKPHPEYGRKIQLQARIEWVSGDKSRSLAGHKVYWKISPPSSNKSGLTGKEKEGFDSAGSGTLKKAANTTADGWCDVVNFYPSLYGGDVFSVFATDKSDYSGGMPTGTYTVWRKFWYQVTEMDDGTGTGSVLSLPAPVTSAFESGYRTVFMEFHEVTPRNKAAYVANLADATARANAARPHFTADSLVPFKAHIMTIDFSGTGSELKSVADTLTGTTWTSADWLFVWRLDPGAFPWKVSAQYQVAGTTTWTDIPNSAISTTTHSTQKGFKKIKLDFSSGSVTPTAAAPVKIKLSVKCAGPNIALGWGGGSHHLFLCTGALHDTDASPNWDLTQRSDCVHEIGHALGLVNLRPAAAGSQSWEDTAHANHCIKPATSCAMFWMSSTTRLTTFHLDGGVGCHDYLRRQDYSRSVLGNQWKD